MSNTDKLREIATRHFPVEEKLSNNSLYNQLQQSSQDNLLSDLTALISENYIPKEFLLWTGENCQYYPDTNEWMYFESPMTQQYFKGTDELFNYWKENEQ